MDILSLILISAFTPVAVLCGIKIYKAADLTKLLKVLAILLLCLELLRFFYNASNYPKAVVPSDKLTFTYISFLVTLELFAVFNKGKLGALCNKIFCLTAFAPIVMALFNSSLYTFDLDTFAVIKALYFVECGLVLTLCILQSFKPRLGITPKDVIITLAFFVLYIAVNFLTRWAWTGKSDLEVMWLISMLVSLASIGIVYGATLLYCKLHKAPQEVQES